MTGADAVAAVLRQHGVDVVFGLPGVHNLALWPALREAGVRVVGVRHEQAAAYAADGHARRTGRLGVALTTTGPGAANAVAATGEAWASGSPVLVIATDVPSTLRRPGVHRGLLHETRDQAAMFGPVVKAAFRAASAEEITTATADAIAAALAPPTRPTYLEIPTDLLFTQSTGPSNRPPTSVSRPKRAGEVEIECAAALLAGAERPLVWVGGGARGAEEAVRALAERLGAPVLETYGARGTLPPEHPLNPGATAHYPAVGALWDEADVVVAIGTDFDGMTTQNWAMPQPRTLITINIDEEDAQKAYAPDALLTGLAEPTTRALLERLPPDDLATTWTEIAEVRAQVRASITQDDPQAAALLDTLADDRLNHLPILADMCIAGYWIASAHAPASPSHLAYPVGWGTLGFALPREHRRRHPGPGPHSHRRRRLRHVHRRARPPSPRNASRSRSPCSTTAATGCCASTRSATACRATASTSRPPTSPPSPGPTGSRRRRSTTPARRCVPRSSRRPRAAEPRMVVVKAALRPPPSTSPRWYRRAERA